jgi:predicted enzyme related to lactoylglutathione lyase
MPPTDMGVGRIAMVSDPCGATFYIMDPVPPPGQPAAMSDVFDPVKAGHVRWTTLWTGDTSKAVPLYASLFGWTQEGAMPMGERGDYLFIQSGGKGIGAIGPALPDGDGPRWEFNIGVDDIDRAAAAVQVGGGRILLGPHEIPGGELSLDGIDPQGAPFGLVGPRKS